ncbi:hypothetical protein GCM10007421_09100 [Halopseudomonas oceani]|uniref:Uncharacterized protein n=1 Tax=Halopseudomonas oceani TaxID=1708783 RepID=A0A2P4EZN3_9GAMM|nr:hypothetical protein [Halopseudomonas oceani]POB06204.1 hypothetical protein C1949_00180 [Halopseudomonas oceani]GGE37402.1 hypothetical protein GCM10007421_09100 [Halopseudomonas oceani]
MDRFALPPAARLLNNILIFFQGTCTLIALTAIFVYPLAAIALVISAAITAGLWFKHPFAYAAVMVSSFIAIIICLRNNDLVAVGAGVLNVLLALYIRLNLHELRASSEADTKPE